MHLIDYYLAGLSAAAGGLTIVVPALVGLTHYFRWLDSDRDPP